VRPFLQLSWPPYGKPRIDQAGTDQIDHGREYDRLERRDRRTVVHSHHQYRVAITARIASAGSRPDRNGRTLPARGLIGSVGDHEQAGRILGASAYRWGIHLMRRFEIDVKYERMNKRKVCT
jgi:hypothetical protein